MSFLSRCFGLVADEKKNVQLDPPKPPNSAGVKKSKHSKESQTDPEDSDTEPTQLIEGQRLEADPEAIPRAPNSTEFQFTPLVLDRRGDPSEASTGVLTPTLATHPAAPGGGAAATAREEVRTPNAAAVADAPAVPLKLPESESIVSMTTAKPRFPANGHHRSSSVAHEATQRPHPLGPSNAIQRLSSSAAVAKPPLGSRGSHPVPADGPRSLSSEPAGSVGVGVPSSHRVVPRKTSAGAPGEDELLARQLEASLEEQERLRTDLAQAKEEIRSLKSVLAAAVLDAVMTSEHNAAGVLAPDALPAELLECAGLLNRFEGKVLPSPRFPPPPAAAVGAAVNVGGGGAPGGTQQLSAPRR